MVTSKKCCQNKSRFRVIFDDKNKSQYLFQGKKQQTKCQNKCCCNKMNPREDQEFYKILENRH